MGYSGKNKRIPRLIQDQSHWNSIQDQIKINFFDSAGAREKVARISPHNLLTRIFVIANFESDSNPCTITFLLYISGNNQKREVSFFFILSNMHFKASLKIYLIFHCLILITFHWLESCFYFIFSTVPPIHVACINVLVTFVSKKVHLGCAYNHVREAITAGIIDYGHIDTKFNIADLLTKPLPTGQFHALAGKYLFRSPKQSKPEQDQETNPTDLIEGE